MAASDANAPRDGASDDANAPRASDGERASEDAKKEVLANLFGSDDEDDDDANDAGKARGRVADDEDDDDEDDAAPVAWRTSSFASRCMRTRRWTKTMSGTRATPCCRRSTSHTRSLFISFSEELAISAA